MAKLRGAYVCHPNADGYEDDSSHWCALLSILIYHYWPQEALFSPTHWAEWPTFGRRYFKVQFVLEGDNKASIHFQFHKSLVNEPFINILLSGATGNQSRFLDGKLWYLQHNCVGDSIVYHQDCDTTPQSLIIKTPNWRHFQMKFQWMSIRFQS